jgi:hypothetical protein
VGPGVPMRKNPGSSQEGSMFLEDSFFTSLYSEAW